ncbi:MAG: HAD hydrolase-like protein, partial [Spirochaetes bacterium]|nr:HAD hydrolase-like protein [Spirochaetota bacterium]
MSYDLCIFDLDGTLIDTRVDITAAVNDMLSNYDLGKKGVDEVTGYVGDGIRKLVERCIMDNRADIEQAISVFKAAYSSR